MYSQLRKAIESLSKTQALSFLDDLRYNDLSPSTGYDIWRAGGCCGLHCVAQPDLKSKNKTIFWLRTFYFYNTLEGFTKAAELAYAPVWGKSGICLAWAKKNEEEIRKFYRDLEFKRVKTNDDICLYGRPFDLPVLEVA